MGVCDVITDIILVIFPIPIVIGSSMPLKRKINLTLLFGLSLGLVGITCYRVPSVINRRGDQQFRSLLASLEILGAAAVSNSIVLGSFIRDRGIKKQRFRLNGSVSESLERTSTRRTLTHHHWGSDEDLARDLGMRLSPELRHNSNGSLPRPAPIALPPSKRARPSSRNHHPPEYNDGISTDSERDHKIHTSEPDIEQSRSSGELSVANLTPRKMSFFDVGGLLDPQSPAVSRQSTSASKTTVAHDFAPTSRRGSRALLQDIGGLLSPHREEEHGYIMPDHEPARSEMTSTDIHRTISHEERRARTPHYSPVRNFSRVGYGQRNDASTSPPSTMSGANGRGASPPYRAVENNGGPVGNRESHIESMSLQDVGGLLGPARNGSAR